MVRQSSQAARASAVLLALVAGAVGAFSAGCGGSAQHVRVLRISERDFRIVAPKRIPAGRVEVELDNHGPDTHELIMVRAVPGQPLPLRSDGLTVDEDALRQRVALTLEGTPRNGTHDQVIDLAPGRYILFCNMAGHYLGGMHATLVVT